MEVSATYARRVQRIQVRSLHPWVTMTAKVAVTLVVRHDQNYIGPVRKPFFIGTGIHFKSVILTGSLLAGQLWNM